MKVLTVVPPYELHIIICLMLERAFYQMVTKAVKYSIRTQLFALTQDMQVSSVAENVGVGVHFNAFVPWQNKVHFLFQDSGWETQHFT